MNTIEKLKMAQDLLSDVYHEACESKNSAVESLMSVAEDCIIDAIEWVNRTSSEGWQSHREAEDARPMFSGDTEADYE